MNKETILTITIAFAISMSVILPMYLVAGVIAILPAIIITIASWLPYLGAKAYLSIE